MPPALTRIGAFAAVITAALACRPTAAPVAVGPAYEAEVAHWRATRLASLTAPQGWLALAGLHWLRDGSYQLGADPSADIVFPAGAPRDIGTVTLANGEVRLQITPGVDARLVDAKGAGEPVTEVVLRSDINPEQPADRVRIGDRFTFLVIARGERLGFRIYDVEASERRDFAGLRAFPIDPAWRLQARFEPLATPRMIEHPTVLGTVQPAEVPGVAVFTVDGVDHRLTPIVEHGPDGDLLLFVFRDGTSGQETYTGGRFLLADPPQAGYVELDFNRAHNPPCAFTAYATCPIPLAENQLPLRITAGEQSP